MEFIGLPCAGKLDPDFLLKALSLGADGVLVLACPEENCRSLHRQYLCPTPRLAEAREYLGRGRDRRPASSVREYFQQPGFSFG